MTAKRYIVTGGDPSEIKAQIGGLWGYLGIHETLKLGHFPEGLRFRHIPTGKELVVMGEEWEKQTLKWQCDKCQSWVQWRDDSCRECGA